MPYKNRSLVLTDVISSGGNTITYVGTCETSPDANDLAFYTAKSIWQIIKFTKNAAGALIATEYPQGPTAGNPNNLTPAFTSENIFVRDDRLGYTYG